MLCLELAGGMERRLKCLLHCFVLGAIFLGCSHSLKTKNGEIRYRDEEIDDLTYNQVECPVHHIGLVERIVPVAGGLIASYEPTEEERRKAELFEKAKVELFPIPERDTVYVGCDTRYKVARVRVCPLCTAAYERWKREND